MKILTRDDTEHGVEYVTRADAEREIESWKEKSDYWQSLCAFPSEENADRPRTSNRSPKTMQNQEPKSKPEDVEEPREEGLDETPCYPSFLGYLPESWSMLKDSIYAAQEAIRAGIENTQELLAAHDVRLGRTTRSNRYTAARMESEIRQMQTALAGLQKPNGGAYGESSPENADLCLFELRNTMNAQIRELLTRIPPLSGSERRLVRDLIDVGTGKIPHRYMGQCPDTVDGHDQRDKNCRACRILIRAKSSIANDQVELPPKGSSESKKERPGG